MELIDKDAVMAEIEKFIDNNKYLDGYDCAYRDGNNYALYALKNKLDALEVKEVDLDKETPNKELADEIYAISKRYPEVSFAKLSRIAVRIAKWQKEQDKKGE